MMNGLDKLINAGDEINSRLVEIRESIGADLGVFIVNPKIEMIIGEELKKLAEGKQGDPIIRNNKFCIAYIKDHSFHDKYSHDSSITNSHSSCFTEGNKVHFYYCNTICYMNRNGRGKRYATTYDIKKNQIIDLRDEKNFETRLALCQNCIKILVKKTRIPIWQLNFNYKQIIAEYSDVKSFANCVELLYNEDDVAEQRTKKFIQDTIKGTKI